MSEVIEQPVVEKSLDPQDRFLKETAAIIEQKRAAEQPKEPSEVVTQVENKEEIKPAVDEKKEEIKPTASEPVTDKKEAPAKETKTPDDFDEAEMLKTLGLNEEKPQSENKNEPLKNELLDEDKRLASEYRRLMEDKEIKAVLDAKASGKSLFELTKEIHGEQDYSKLSDEELFELDLSKRNLSDERKAIEREKFNGMLVSQQEDLGNKIKQGLNAKRSEWLEQQKNVNAQHQAILKANAQKAITRIQELKENKVYKNLSITPEMWEKIDGEIAKNFEYDENLEFNIDRIYKRAIHDLYENELILANVKKATTKAKVEVLTDVTRPSTGATNSHTAPPVTGEKEDRDKEYNSFIEERKKAYKN